MSQCDSDRRMPFGKYKDWSIEAAMEENPGYLRWMMENVDMDRWPGLFAAIREELARKGELNE